MSKVSTQERLMVDVERVNCLEVGTTHWGRDLRSLGCSVDFFMGSHSMCTCNLRERAKCHCT